MTDMLHIAICDDEPASCRFSDRVLVFHEGKLVQSGTHNELVLDDNGKYYELWYAQAQYYTDEEKAVLV